MDNQCPICGKPIGRNKIACSMACSSILRSNKKSCVVCGDEFPAPPSSAKDTCSPECSKANRKKLHEKGVYAGTLVKAHEAAKHNPLMGRFETNMHAKEWVIQAPDGAIYRCRNLKNWLRDHEDLLDGTVQQAYDGISKIKYSAQGKRKNKNDQWKGWRLLEWDS